MEVLGSRILLRPTELATSRGFYRDVLGLAVYREFGDPADPAVVFHLGGGHLEVSGSAAGSTAGGAVSLWLQVRDVEAEHRRLAALDVPILRPPRLEPWGLVEMWIADPDGIHIAVIEIPPDHPLRRR